MKTIKFVIDSDLENVALVGMSVNKLCSLTSFTGKQVFQAELCAVEAINNSILHANNGLSKQEIELTFIIKKDYLFMEVCDKGKPMTEGTLENANLYYPDGDSDNIDNISETGRGLGLIKEFMDKVTYRSNNDVNYLTMIKYF